MVNDYIHTDNIINIDFTPENSAAADSASSVTRSIPALRAPNSNPNDYFSHQGRNYELIRFYPNPQNIAETPDQTITVQLLTTQGPLSLKVRTTAQTDEFIHVAWIDDNGEPMGTWLPKP